MKANTVVIYHYFEKSDEYKENLTYFLRCGYRTDLDYIISISGGCSVPLPSAPNISYHHIPNGGFDYGGHSYVVNNALNIEQYDFFLFLNSSVRGPFLPSYFHGAWPRIFTDLIDDQTRLVGATINILGKDHPCSRISYFLDGSNQSLSHVQSTIYAMDRTALLFLVQKGFFQNDISANDAIARAWARSESERGPRLLALFRSLRHRRRCRRSPAWAAQRTAKFAAILKYEIKLSQIILINGWNIACLLPEYRKIDYRKPHEDINWSSLGGDPCFRGAYCGRSMHPFETVFIKTSRDIVDHSYLKSLEATQALSAGEAASAYHAAPLDGVLGNIQSAWKGHGNFATWLVTRLKPGVVVDLGIESGYSAFCFARSSIGQVFGIDSFEGDIHFGRRDTFAEVRNSISQLGLSNVTLVRGRSEEVAQIWDKEVGILHIDGCHTYADAKRNYESWSNFVVPDGIVLLHGTCVANYGVRRLFNEIKLPKTNFAIACGLGVISKNESLISEIAAIFSSLIEPGTTALMP